MHSVTQIQLRDMDGHFIDIKDDEPVDGNSALLYIGQTFIWKELPRIVVKEALVEHVQHVNIRVIEEDENILEPHF